MIVIFEELRIQTGLKSLPPIYVDAKNHDIEAEARREFRHQVIVISGGLLAEAGRQSLTARTILAHEMAHIANGDTFFLNLVTWVRILPWILTISLVVSLVSIGPNVVVVVLSVTAAAVGYWIMTTIVKRGIKRREFYADAAAANVLSDDEGFRRLLSPIAKQDQPFLEYSNQDKSFKEFHPLPEDRLSALTKFSPVTRPSIFNILVGIYLGLGTAIAGINVGIFIAHLGIFPDFPSETIAIDTAIEASFAGAILSVAAVLFMELTKPWGRLKVCWSVRS
jgi:hypothetical protein